MAVDTDTLTSAGLFVPFRTAMRGGPEGRDPVGTLMVEAEATGAAGGGSVIAGITSVAQPFGFPMLWVPTHISLSDNLAAAEVINFQFRDEGNARLNTEIGDAVNALAGSQGNVRTVRELSLVIDVTENGDTALRIMLGSWSTNTDTKTYHLHVYGPVYDAQIMARSDRVPELVAGLR